MKRRVRSNARSLSVVALMVAAFALTALLALAHPNSADAARARGFEPTAATLACINAGEGHPAYDSDDSRTYRGRYQSDRAFEVQYAVNMIPSVHWWTLKSHTWDRADRWHPLIQDEMARNGVRARGLQPWPPVRYKGCPR